MTRQRARHFRAGEHARQCSTGCGRMIALPDATTCAPCRRAMAEGYYLSPRATDTHTDPQERARRVALYMERAAKNEPLFTGDADEVP